MTKLQTKLVPVNDAPVEAGPAIDLDSAPPLPADLPRPKTTRRLAISFAALGGDMLAITAAFALSNVIRFGDNAVASDMLNMLIAILPVYLGTALNSGAYGTRAISEWRIGVYRAATSLLFTIGAALLAVYFLKASSDFSRLAFGLGLAVAFALIFCQRFLLALLSRRVLGLSPVTEIVICDNVEVEPAGRFVIDAKRYRLAPRIDDPAMMHRLGCVLKDADRVVVACAPKDRQRWALALKGADINAEVLAPELDDLGPLRLGTLGGQTTLQVATGQLGLTDRTLKRLLDLGLTIAALPVLLPVMIVVAIAIKLDSPGSVFFIQRRIGQGNRMFNMYKFRSMHAELTDRNGARSASRDDDRITRVGRFIRSTSLDELPQILNVLSGSMSIVGPRPHATASTADNLLFWDIDHRYWDRHAMKPGLTGLAQIRGFRGATTAQADLKNRLQADLEYLSGWTVWRDIAIIFSTFRVLVHRNAF